MKILVTGAAGFLGSYLCEALLDLEHEVVGVDNFYTGSLVNIEHLQGNSRFEVIEHDVTEPLNLECDGIFNLACPASPVHYQRDPVATMRTSVVGAINVLDLARRNNARILQASTSEIYGDPEVSPQPEEYWGRVNPIGIRSCYDEGKRAAETLFFDYHRQYSVEIRIARIFNTYGPRMSFDDGRVVSNFILQALRNEPITVYGDGRQIRSFCYATDLVDGLIKLFFSEDIHQPLNLGNPEPITMLELAKQIIEITESKSEIRFSQLPLDDPKTREPNIEKAISLLGWNPKVKRREGLENTINDFRSRLEGIAHGKRNI